MPNRTAKFLSAVIACLGAGVPLTASRSATPAPAADECLLAPKNETPDGSHWYFRIEHPSNRRCWYLREAGDAQTAPSNSSASARPVSPAPDKPMPGSVANARAELRPPRAGIDDRQRSARELRRRQYADIGRGVALAPAIEREFAGCATATARTGQSARRRAGQCGAAAVRRGSARGRGCFNDKTVRLGGDVARRDCRCAVGCGPHRKRGVPGWQQASTQSLRHSARGASSLGSGPGLETQRSAAAFPGVRHPPAEHRRAARTAASR
jgi:hypothetical protein